MGQSAIICDLVITRKNGGRSGIRTLEDREALPVFLTTMAFATKQIKPVCGLDFAFTITRTSFRWEPSSLYTF